MIPFDKIRELPKSDPRENADVIAKQFPTAGGYVEDQVYAGTRSGIPGTLEAIDSSVADAAKAALERRSQR